MLRLVPFCSYCSVIKPRITHWGKMCRIAEIFRIDFIPKIKERVQSSLPDLQSCKLVLFRFGLSSN